MEIQILHCVHLLNNQPVLHKYEENSVKKKKKVKVDFILKNYLLNEYK